MSNIPNTTLGVHLLETITLGMYSEPLHCIREYIQNAFDSIRAARRLGLLDANAGCVDLIVDPDAKHLRIRDNGTGLAPEDAVVQLVDIGYSAKATSAGTAATNAGFRGIGRMAGISYCNNLVFETTDGAGVTCLITFDARAINQLTRPGQEPTTIVEAINKNCAVVERPSESDGRFLQVSLEQVTDSSLLDVDALSAYLEQTAPVRQDPTMWKFRGKIRSIAEAAGYPNSLDTISVRVCHPDGSVIREIYRPFKDSFVTRNARGQRKRRVDVTDIVPLPRTGDYQGWWGWLATHERRGALADVPFAGLRVRMHNIAIGDHSLLRPHWTTSHLAQWCFGEIHVVDSTLVPNSQRDNFEPSRALARFQSQLREESRLIEKEIRSESQQRNTSVSTIVKKAEQVTNSVLRRLETGLTSHDEKLRLIDRIDGEAIKLNNAIHKRNQPEAGKLRLRNTLHVLDEIKQRLKSVKHTGADASMSHLNKQARKAVRTVLAVVKEELNDDTRFAAIEERVFVALRPGGKGT